MEKLNGLDWFIGAILIVGGINWAMIGLFDTNIVSSLFGDMTLATRTVYTLVGLSALYVAVRALMASTNESTHRVAHS